MRTPETLSSALGGQLADPLLDLLHRRARVAAAVARVARRRSERHRARARASASSGSSDEHRCRRQRDRQQRSGVTADQPVARGRNGSTARSTVARDISWPVCWRVEEAELELLQVLVEARCRRSNSTASETLARDQPSAHGAGPSEDAGAERGPAPAAGCRLGARDLDGVRRRRSAERRDPAEVSPTSPSQARSSRGKHQLDG